MDINRGQFDFSIRSSGVLLHLQSLPGPHGSGDLGPEAYHFLEFLEKAGQSWWQMLPVGIPGIGPSFSPYDSVSAFAGSHWFVSLHFLANEGLLTRKDLKPDPGLSGTGVNFNRMQSYRDERLRRAYRNFIKSKGQKEDAFIEFCGKNTDWLEDFELFMALRKEYHGKPWTEWHEDLRERQPDALQNARQRLADETAFHRFVQFKFDQQWKSLIEESHRRGIGIIGDIPIFVAHDSSDVWSHQELFQLDKYGRPRRVSGYPPDRFNQRGQVWGHPQYAWHEHQLTDFAWWVKRFTRIHDLFDAVRVDHFLGFTRTWSIPPDSGDAGSGRWVKSPGLRLFEAVRRNIGKCPMIAEDLGHITPEDEKLRDRTGMVPMRIFQFGFDTEQNSAVHLPHNYPPMCAAYTGTHDNDTIRGWYLKLPRGQRKMVLKYTGGASATIHRDCIRTIQSSTANLVIFPLQDLLGLGTKARMNIPGTTTGNWKWRSDPYIPRAIITELRQQTRMFGRIR
jgi:4-alpha-glucanotransferase